MGIRNKKPRDGIQDQGDGSWKEAGEHGGKAFIVEKKDVGRGEAESIPSRRRRGRSGGQELKREILYNWLK